MQSNSFHNDLIQFKDEIFKKIRLLENQLTTEINDKYTETNILCESINNRLSLLNNNNNSLLESLTSQKLNFDKIESIEKSFNNFEQSLITNDIKIKKVISDVEYLSTRCDKIISDNLNVTGYIGPGCQFKNISEYIKQNILDFSKMKLEKDKLIIENKSLKSKVDSIIKSSSTLVNNAIFNCQKYSDEKYSDIKNLIVNQNVEINEKNVELRALIDKGNLENKKNIENIISQVDQLKKIKNELINMTENKINEINSKIENIIQEIDIIKTDKKEINKINRKTMLNINNKLFLNSSEHKKNKSGVINNESPPKTSSRERIIINSNNSVNSNTNESIKEYKSDENRKNNINNKIMNEIEIKEENMEKILPIYNKIQEEQKEDNDKIKENFVINELLKNKIIIDNNKNSQKNEKEISENNKENNNNNNQNEKPKKFSESLKNEIKEEKILFKKINPIIPEKTIEFNLLKEIQKEDKNTSTISIKKNKEENNSQLINSLNNSIKSPKINNIKSNKTILSERGKSEAEFPLVPKLVKKEILNKMKILTSRHPLDNIHNKSAKKKLDKKLFSQNEEQKQIMDYIKHHYNIIKEKQEQKSQENVVNCNIINLQLNKKNKRKQKNSSADIYIDKNKKKDTLSEFGMKLSPAFGRTSYNFYIKDKLQDSFDEIKNKFPKMNTLKTTLNAAFVKTIKNKIFFSDKGI